MNQPIVFLDWGNNTKVIASFFFLRFRTFVKKKFSLESFIVITIVFSVLQKKLIKPFCLYCPWEKSLKSQVGGI